MTEEKEESPYQIYYNMYCGECDDNGCVTKKFIDINKEIVRTAIFECAKLRNLLRNYYKD